MVSGDSIAKELAENRVDFYGMFGSGGRVVDFSDDFGGVRVGFGGEVGLPCRGELSEVVPETGESTPLAGDVTVGTFAREHLGGKLSGEMGDFVEMTVVRAQIGTFGAGTVAGNSGAALGEQWLPWRSVFRSMCEGRLGEVLRD